MFEAVWGGLLGGFGHTVFYPVNPNPPRATSTHITHLYLTLPCNTRVVWGDFRVVWGVLGWFGVVWGVSMDRFGPIYSEPHVLPKTHMKFDYQSHQLRSRDKKLYSVFKNSVFERPM